MRSDKALTLFNQIVGVKVLDDLDSFIRTNMLEEVPAEEKYQELKDNFQNLMEAKTNIDKVKEQIAQLEPINTLAKELMAIDTRIAELEQEKSGGLLVCCANGGFVQRGVGALQEQLEKTGR